MAKLCFHENVDFLPECSEMYAKPESWIPADKHLSEKLGEHNFVWSPFFLITSYLSQALH